MLITNATSSWWVHPLAVAEGDFLWLGSVDRRGANHVRRIDTVNETVNLISLAGPSSSDDHNAVALAVVPDKPILAFYSQHQKDAYVRLQAIDRASLAAGSQQQLHMGGAVSYAQVLTREDTVYLFCRVSQNLWRYRISVDWGQTWDEARTLIDGTLIGQNYAVLRPDPDDPLKIRLFHYGHPNNSSYRPVGYARLDLATGSIHHIGGTVLGNLNDVGGPTLLPQMLDLAINPSTGFTVRMLDIGTVEGAPAVAYAVWKPADATYAPRYRLKRWDGSSWDGIPWSLTSGVPFGHSYYGGVAIGESGQLWTSREAVGEWVIEQWQYSAGNVALIGELARARTKLVRPYAVRGTGSVPMIYQDNCYSSYTLFYGDTVVPL